MMIKTGLLASTMALALAAAPLDHASAHEYYHGGYYRGFHGGPVFGVLGAVGAVVAGAAAIATAPLAILGAPGYYGPAYYPPPAPAYYAAPYGYAYPVGGYVYGRPGYYGPRGYIDYRHR